MNYATKKRQNVISHVYFGHALNSEMTFIEYELGQIYIYIYIKNTNDKSNATLYFDIFCVHRH